MTKILIADDNQTNLYLLESLLKGNGFDVISARNGAEALDAAGKNPPDLIITDILMPVMDGFELCRQWKADDRLNHIPFIFYTATYTDPKDEHFACSLGADRFIIKPQKPEVLVQVVREVLEEFQHDTTSAPLKPLGDEMELLRQYNKVLFRKLEKKVLQLEADIAKRKRIEDTLNRATKKLSFLNGITFNDIQNAVFSLSGYLELEKKMTSDETLHQYLQKQAAIMQTIRDSLMFARNYQDLGLRPPAWQNVGHTFLYAISHIDLRELSRDLRIGGLEIYADPLLERVFLTLAENVVLHGKTATTISLYYRETTEGLTLVFEDDGVGIPDDLKERIFERRFEGKKGIGLFLAREILSITDIPLTETGKHGNGARFEMVIPKGSYRFSQKKG